MTPTEELERLASHYEERVAQHDGLTGLMPNIRSERGKETRDIHEVTAKVIREVIATRRASGQATSESAEPAAWVIPGDDNANCNGFIDAMAWQEGEFSRPLYAHPQPPTVEAAAQVLLDQPYDVMVKAFEAMDRRQGEGADRIMSAALRALASKGGQHE